MPETRKLHLGAFMRPVSIHTAWWRYPGAAPDANFNFKHLTRFAQKLEEGKFDAFFMADHLAVLNMPMNALMRSATTTSFDPMILLPALAAVTDKLGLIATGSTTFEEPYLVARRFASLDHISNGRAAWNVVTTSNPDSALNFGRETHMAHAERYRRAREFIDVVKGLWDSWADDAFVRDVENGVYFDPARLHVLDHHGPYFNVRGPLNVARPVQGHAVIVQAGASNDGRQLAAETSEMVFAAGGPIAMAQEYYADVKARARAVGRDPDLIKIMWWGKPWPRRNGRRITSTVWCMRTAASRRSRSRWGWTRRSSTSMDRCRKFPIPTRASRAGNAWWRAPSGRI